MKKIMITISLLIICMFAFNCKPKFSLETCQVFSTEMEKIVKEQKSEKGYSELYMRNGKKILTNFEEKETSKFKSVPGIKEIVCYHNSDIDTSLYPSSMSESYINKLMFWASLRRTYHMAVLKNKNDAEIMKKWIIDMNKPEELCNADVLQNDNAIFWCNSIKSNSVTKENEKSVKPKIRKKSINIVSSMNEKIFNIGKTTLGIQ